MLARLIFTAAVAILAGIASDSVHSQAYPSRPIRIVVPAAPGGTFDFVSRLVAERLSAALGQQVIVDNRPGGQQTIALDLVAKAAADGHTLVAMGDSITILPFVSRKLTFDPRTSFAPIVLMTTQTLVLAVHAAVPATDFKEFVSLAKAKRGALSFAASDVAQHLTGELIKRMGGIDMIHVPYKGGAPAISDLVGGQVPAAVLGSTPVIPHARAGRVRVLAVTSAVRSASLPNVLTLAESGLSGFDVYQWLCLFAPAKTPKEIVTRLNGQLTKILMQPAVRERIEAAGLEPRTGSPREVEVLIRAGHVRWGNLITEVGLKLD